MSLITEPNLEQPDDFYETLVGLHQGLTADQSRLVNTRLILLMANQIGRQEVLDACVREARGDL